MRGQPALSRIPPPIELDSDEAITLPERDSAGLTWRRSSRCADTTCVEVAVADDFVLVRDSKDLDGPVLRFTHSEWSVFASAICAGEFERA